MVKKVLVILSTVLILGACGKKDEGPTLDEIIAQQEAEQSLTQTSVPLEGMTIQRENFNMNKYVNAAQQQFNEIDAPFVRILLTQVENIDGEIYTVLTDSDVESRLIKDDSYDLRGWLQDKQFQYQSVLISIQQVATPHPDTLPTIKEKYQDVINDITQRLEYKNRAINGLILQLDKKNTGYFNSFDVYEALNSTVYSVSGRRTPAVKTDIIFKAIEKEFNYMNEKEREKFDARNRPKNY